MVFYAERDVPSVLRERPTLDREATDRMVERLAALALKPRKRGLFGRRS